MITFILSRAEWGGRNLGKNWNEDGVKVAQRKRKAEIREEIWGVGYARCERRERTRKKEKE